MRNLMGNLFAFDWNLQGGKSEGVCKIFSEISSQWDLIFKEKLMVQKYLSPIIGKYSF